MKRLFLIWIFSGSLDGFSQELPAELPKSEYTLEVKDYGYTNPRTDTSRILKVRPDTIRAIILVTTSPNGIAHSRMGYVVVADGRKPVYLTCDKKALKLPQVGWGYEVVGKEGKR